MKYKPIILSSFKELLNEKECKLCTKLFKDLQFNDLFSIIYSNINKQVRINNDDKAIMLNCLITDIKNYMQEYNLEDININEEIL